MARKSKQIKLPAQPQKPLPVSKTSRKAGAPTGVAVRVAIDVPDGTPAHYANYIEISHTKWDFALIAARLPAKHSAAKIVDMQATGILPLHADVTINFPPTLIAGLIRALTVQKEAYEKETKTELKETGDEPSGQKRKRRRG